MHNLIRYAKMLSSKNQGGKNLKNYTFKNKTLHQAYQEITTLTQKGIQIQNINFTRVESTPTFDVKITCEDK